MKKKNFLMVTLLCCLTISSAIGQELFKINPSSNEGFYVRISGGYSLGTGKTSGGANGLMPTYNTKTVVSTSYQNYSGSSTSYTTNKTTKSNAKFSLGGGLNIALGAGYMFNEYIGTELGIDYLHGTTNTVETKNNTNTSTVSTITSSRTSSTNNSSTTNSMQRSGISVTPSIKLVVPINKEYSLYSRMGIVIPVLNKMTYEYISGTYKSSFSSSDKTNSSSNSNSREVKNMEFTSYFNLGYSASFGVDFALGKQLSLFGEVNIVSNSFEAKSSTITKWEKTSSGSDTKSTYSNLLSGLSTYDKKTDYQKNYTVDNTGSSTNTNKPYKDVSFSLPASSVGIAVGIIYKL